MKVIIIQFLFVFLLCNSSYSAQPNDITVCSNDLVNSGCILINENNQTAQDGKVQIFYHWLNPFDPSKQTFFFLIGGPGAPMDYYLKFEKFWRSTTLGQKYNLLFFDPRGVGKSTPVTQENVIRRNLKNYTFSGMVEDIEGLRQALVPGQKIGVIGHSTGGHLVFSYAVKYPENVFKIISMHGAVSEIGFLTQMYLRQKEVASALSGLQPTEITQLAQKIQSGNTCFADGSKLHPTSWQLLMNFALYGTYSQRQSLPSIILDLFQGNIITNKYCQKTNISSLTNSLILDPPALDPLLAMGGINLLINNNVVCSNLITSKQAQTMQAPYHDPILSFWTRQCFPFLQSGQIIEEPFDLKAAIANLKMPILIVGAEHDQWVSPIAQNEIWDAFTTSQKNQNKMTILSNCSHFSFYECPTDLSKSLNDFLN